MQRKQRIRLKVQRGARKEIRTTATYTDADNHKINKKDERKLNDNRRASN